MAHEIREKNLFQIAKQSAKEIGYKSLAAYGFLVVFIIVIAVTFILVQQNQDLRQEATYDQATKTFSDNFNAQPAAPQPFTQLGQNEWDVQVHTRQPSFWYTLEGIDAQHGHDCGAPPATHHINKYEDMVFRCKDHLMTSLNASDYGVIYLTPNAMVDWSNGSASIEWEMSTARQSIRDWPDIWISPWDQNLALPFGSTDPDLQGPPNDHIHISFGATETNPFLSTMTGGVNKEYGETWQIPSIRTDIKTGTNNAATRQKFRLTITPTRLTFERLESPTAPYMQFWSHTIPTLNFQQGVVQFGHHSYTPTKDNSGEPGTWHWDAVKINPAIPLTFIKADKRYVDGTGGVVKFNAPAPAGASLRFNAIGNVRVNDAAVQAQPTSYAANGVARGEHFASYFVPIPEGTTQVTLSMTPSSAYPAFARDFAIWSKGASDPGTNPSTAPTTAVATPTVTPVPSAPSTTVAPSSPPLPTPLSVLSLTPNASTVTNGQTFSSEVRLNTNGQSVNGIETTVTYPSNRLSVVSVTNGTSFEVEAEKTLSSGSIKLAYRATNPKIGDHTIATITFRAISAGSANVSLANSIVAESSSNTNVFKSSTGATYTVVNPTPTPTNPPTPFPTRVPTATVAPTATPTVAVQPTSAPTQPILQTATPTPNMNYYFRQAFRDFLRRLFGR